MELGSLESIYLDPTLYRFPLQIISFPLQSPLLSSEYHLPTEYTYSVSN